jgi:hypothetical protein
MQISREHLYSEAKSKSETTSPTTCFETIDEKANKDSQYQSHFFNESLLALLYRIYIDSQSNQGLAQEHC